MMQALYTAASGMMAQQMNVDTISNNLSNVSTTGFKKARVDFQDLLYHTVKRAGSQPSAPGVQSHQLAAPGPQHLGDHLQHSAHQGLAVDGGAKPGQDPVAGLQLG